MTARPTEIEPPSNRLVVHRASAALLPVAVRLDIHPNTVTFAGLLFGLAAAACYVHWTDWRLATAGFVLMIGWHIMDGLDGQLARATGRSSDLGRLLDGVADYATFIAVYLVLALTHPQPQLAFALAAAAGLAHALQSQFYEGERATPAAGPSASTIAAKPCSATAPARSTRCSRPQRRPSRPPFWPTGNRAPPVPCAPRPCSAPMAGPSRSGLPVLPANRCCSGSGRLSA
jgi:phosphatidylglycerophosphate synthase